MKKSVKFIPHAIERMKKRGITDKMVLDTLKFSERIDAGRGGRKIAQKMFGDKLLRVIYEEKDDAVQVITAYLTSKVEKYR